MQEMKPIKRSKELAPLSREHHDGLMYVWKIREGIKNGASVDKLSNYTKWFWLQHIKPHFYQEEKILLPYIPSDHEFAIRLQREHENIREFILNLDTEADTTTFLQLCDLLNDHIRFEERQLFPYLEQTVSTEDLKKIFELLEEHPVCATGWDDEFWLKK